MMSESVPYNFDYRYLSQHRRHRWEQPNFEQVSVEKKDLGKKTINVEPLKPRRKNIKNEDKLFFYRFTIPDQIKKQSDDYVNYRKKLGSFIKNYRYG